MVGQDVVIHAVAAVDTTPQRHRFASDVPFQSCRIAEDQQSATAPARCPRRNRRLVARLPVLVYCRMGCVGQNGGGGVQVQRVGAQGHGDVPIFRKYCRTISWTFVKQVGQ